MKHYHELFRPIVFSFLKLLTFNKEYALCLEKKTFLIVFPQHGNIHNEQSLLRMLIWTAWKLFRGGEGGPDDGSDRPEDGPLPEYPLMQLFESLSKRRKQVMKLFYIEGISMQDIAVLLHREEQTIRNTLSKSLELIRKEYEGSEGETDLVFA